MFRSRLAGAVLAVMTAGAIVLAGCGGDDDANDSASKSDATATTTTAAPAPKVVTFTAADFSFQTPKQIAAGPTEIKLDNHGMETHQAALVRLTAGATPAQYLGALATNFGSAAKFGTFVGGPNEAAPAHSSAVVANLEPGNYLVLCLIPSPSDGKPHALKGMQASLVVTPPAVAAPATPRDTPTLELKDFSFDLPQQYQGGPLQVVNHGTQAHEAVIVQLPDGVELSDVVASAVPAFTPAKVKQPYLDIAGTTPLAPGEKAFLDLKLEPGRYALLCFLPDSTKPNTDHLHNGMATVFTVN